MKFKEIEIIKESFFGNMNYIATYHDYYRDDEGMMEKFESFPPHKGDVIKVMNKNTHKDVFLKVSHVFIDYIENTMSIWCK